MFKIVGIEGFEEILDSLEPYQVIALDTETTGLDVFEEGFDIKGISIAWRKYNVYHPLDYQWNNLHMGAKKMYDYIQNMYEGIDGIYLTDFSDRVKLKDILQDKVFNGRKVIMHNAKYDLQVIEKVFGIRVEKEILDTMLASYLLDETLKEGHGLKNLSAKYLIPIEHFPGTLFIATGGDKAGKYAINDAVATYRLWELFHPRLEEEVLMSAYEKELRTLYILKDMEMNGMLLDQEYIKETEINVVKRLKEVEQEIYKLADRQFLISSPKQLAQVLFVEIGLPYKEVGKSGVPSTAENVLSAMKGKHAIIDKILEYRGLEKIRGTFIESFKKFVSKDGRLRCKFNGIGTTTGRISCSRPNLQQVPSESNGINLRKCFIAPEGKKIVYFDLSQIELRMTAHFSGDETMIDAYNHDRDLHAETASKIFNKPLEQVTEKERKICKTVNFLIVYGGSHVALAQRLDMSEKKAKKFIDKYFETFPKIKEFAKKCYKKIEKEGYIRSMGGRKRRFVFNPANERERAQVYRQSANTKIQSSSADLFKYILIRLQEKYQNKDAKLLGQVHDAAFIEVEEQDAERILEEVKQIAEHPFTKTILKVPLKIDIKIIDRWS